MDMGFGDSVTIVGLTALIFAVVNFLRFLTNFKKNKSAVLTQALAWIGAILIVAISSHSIITKEMVVFGWRLQDLDLGSVVLAGLMIGSSASVLDKLLGAFDNTRSSAAPPRLPDNSQVPASPE